jgi:WhiB family redox-sensing transcriptional regulator
MRLSPSERRPGAAEQAGLVTERVDSLVIEGVAAVFIAQIPREGGADSTGNRGTPPVWAVEPDEDGSLPCRTEQADLWFAEHPEQLGRAQSLCHACPIRRQCLAGALQRREPWGVWGGEIFERGRVIPFKRGRGRPVKVRSEREDTVA